MIQDTSKNFKPSRRRQRPKKTKNPGFGKSKFGNEKFGARVTDEKPENIKEILENVFEKDPPPPKQKIVNRPKNKSEITGRPNQVQSGEQSSPLLGYKNTGGLESKD